MGDHLVIPHEVEEAVLGANGVERAIGTPLRIERAARAGVAAVDHDVPAAVIVLTPGEAAVARGAGAGVNDLQRRRRTLGDDTRRQIDVHELRGAAAVAHGHGVCGVERLGVAHVGELREALDAAGGRRPAEKIVVQEAVAVWLPMRVEERLTVFSAPPGAPARRGDVATVHRLEGEERLARHRLLAHRRDVLRIALQDLLDAFGELLFLFIRASREDDELPPPLAVTRDEGQLRAVGRHGGISALIGRFLPELTVREPFALRRRHRLRRQLGRELAVEARRRFAEDAGERRPEAAALAGRHPRPEMAQRIGPAALFEPFEVGRAGQVGHRHTEELAAGIELSVGGETTADGPLAQNGRTERAVWAARAGDAPLDHGRVALQHPAWRIERDRVERQEVREQPLLRVARRPHEVDEMRRLVHGQQVDPVAVLADRALRVGRLGVVDDARRVEQRQRDPVRVGHGIHDHHVRHLLRREADFLHHRTAHRFEPRRRPLRPPFRIRGVVHAKVRRGDRAPIRGGTLRDERHGRRERQEQRNEKVRMSRPTLRRAAGMGREA